MNNLFNIFDPTTMKYEANWSETFLPLIMTPSLFWAIPSRHNMMYSLISKKLAGETSTLMKKKTTSEQLLFTSLFLTILMINLPGLLPYSFTSTTHLSITLSLALPMWMFSILFLTIKKNQVMFSHLIPQGTPTLLMPFMVMIETISNIIRPITLSVRLAANMIAGHLLISLLSSQGPKMTNMMLPLLLTTMFLLMMLETAVAIIQSYVFSTLSTLYMSETS